MASTLMMQMASQEEAAGKMERCFYHNDDTRINTADYLSVRRLKPEIKMCFFLPYFEVEDQ